VIVDVVLDNYLRWFCYLVPYNLQAPSAFSTKCKVLDHELLDVRQIPSSIIILNSLLAIANLSGGRRRCFELQDVPVIVM